MFDDIWDFSIDRTQTDGAKSYFLGCVVSYAETGEQRFRMIAVLLAIIFETLFVHIADIHINFDKFNVFVFGIITRKN